MSRAIEARGDRAIGRPYAAVKVMVDRGGKTLRLVECQEGELPIVVLKADALIAPLASGIRVLDPDGNEILPSRGFFITTETFDPFHLLTDFD